MSLLHAAHVTAPYRRDNPTQLRVPVVLPLVRVSIDGAGQLDVAVDDEPYGADAVLTRSDLHGILDRIATDLGTPIRVEIHEPSGSHFTDIVTPTAPRAHQADPADQTPRSNVLSFPGEVTGDGFLPEEEVAVAVVVAHQIANPDGTARLRLPAALLAGRPGLVVLLGRTSGTIAISGGPA